MATPPPLVDGWQQLTANWSLTLPFPMARRVEDASLVFWHSPRKITFWLSLFGADMHQNARAAIDHVKAIQSPAIYDEMEEGGGGLMFYSYRLLEADDGRQPSFYGHVAESSGARLLIAGYFDAAEWHQDVLKTWRSVRFSDQSLRHV